MVRVSSGLDVGVFIACTWLNSVKSTENLITHNIKIARNSLRTPLPNSIVSVSLQKLCNYRYIQVSRQCYTISRNVGNLIDILFSCNKACF